MDIMSLAHDLVVNMAAPFMLCIVGFFAMCTIMTVARNITRQINQSGRLEHERKMASEARQAIDTKLIDARIEHRDRQVTRDRE